MKKSNSKGGVVGVGNGSNNNNNNEEIDWELRPGGMLVQKRDDDDDDGGGGSSGPMIKIRVSHGSYQQHEINIPAQSTFGDLKKLLAHETGLEPKEQRLLFRGKEKEDVDCLHMVGVKNMSKVVLLEDPASKERKLEEIKMDDGVAKACEEVVKVRSEVDKLAVKVSALESAVHSGKKVAEKEFIVLTELLMVKLLKLDSIQADGEAKVQRRIEVRRVQGFVDTLDDLKARNSNPFSNSSSGSGGGVGGGSSSSSNNSNSNSNSNNSLSVTTKWESFEGGFGSLSAPQPQPQPIPTSPQSSSKDWERFN